MRGNPLGVLRGLPRSGVQRFARPWRIGFGRLHCVALL